MGILNPPIKNRTFRTIAQICCAGSALCLLFFSGGQGLSAQNSTSREYQVKAAFLFNFVKFVEWPSTAFAAADSPLSIGVLGDNPFGSVLDETVRGETVRNRRLMVRQSHRLEELNDCQVIFISRSERGRIGDILPQLSSRPVLSVSEQDGFVERGGIINFYLEGNKVRFQINPGAARNAGLKMSSQLLSLGKIVE